MRQKINKYIEWSMENDSCDNGVLELAETLRKWGDNDLDSISEMMEEPSIFDEAYEEAMADL